MTMINCARRVRWRSRSADRCFAVGFLIWLALISSVSANGFIILAQPTGTTYSVQLSHSASRPHQRQESGVRSQTHHGKPRTRLGWMWARSFGLLFSAPLGTSVGHSADHYPSSTTHDPRSMIHGASCSIHWQDRANGYSRTLPLRT